MDLIINKSYSMEENRKPQKPNTNLIVQLSQRIFGNKKKFPEIPQTIKVLSSENITHLTPEQGRQIMEMVSPLNNARGDPKNGAGKTKRERRNGNNSTFYTEGFPDEINSSELTSQIRTPQTEPVTQKSPLENQVVRTQNFVTEHQSKESPEVLQPTKTTFKPVIPARKSSSALFGVENRPVKTEEEPFRTQTSRESALFDDDFKSIIEARQRKTGGSIEQPIDEPTDELEMRTRKNNTSGDSISSDDYDIKTPRASYLDSRRSSTSSNNSNYSNESVVSKPGSSWQRRDDQNKLRSNEPTTQL